MSNLKNDSLSVDISYVYPSEFLAAVTRKLAEIDRLGGTEVHITCEDTFNLNINFQRPETDDERKRREQTEVARTERKHEQIKELAEELGYYAVQIIERDEVEEDERLCGSDLDSIRDPDLHLPEAELKAKDHEKWAIQYGRGGY